MTAPTRATTPPASMAGATKARGGRARDLAVAWAVPVALLALVLLILAATGMFRRGAPYYGRPAEVGQRLELTRWTIAVERAWLERSSYGSREALVVQLTAYNDDLTTSYGPDGGVLMAIFGDEYLPLGDCRTLPDGGSRFSPFVLTGATCQVDLTQEGLLLPPGDLPVKVVLRKEVPSTNPIAGDDLEPDLPLYYVELTARDTRERE